MKISVVITCYNLERYIAQSIDSVLNQQAGNYSTEIIVVDDKSTDSSIEVIRNYSEVMLVQNSENRGVMLSTLEGMSHCSGDIICFLDGDDIWRNNKLCLVARRFEDNEKLVFLTHNYRYIDENGNIIDKWDSSQSVLMKLEDEQEISEKIRNGVLSHGGFVWLGSAHSIRASCLDFPKYKSWVENLPYPKATYQDWPLAYWVASSMAGDFGYLREILFDYRIHLNNYSGDARTVEKMIRNLTKTHNTNLALLDIAGRVFPCEQSIISSEKKAHASEYLLELYQGHRIASVNLFIRSFKYFLEKNIILKEIFRLISILLIGPGLFLRATK